MTAREVVGTVEWPGGAGAPIVGARVTASIYAGVDGDLVYATGDVQAGQSGCMTDSTGSWSLTLTPNSLLTPTGTVYLITIDMPDAASITYYIDVPDTAGPHEATDILAEQPGAVPSQALAAHAALTTAHGATGSVVGTTNSQTLTNKTLTTPTINTPAVTGGTWSGGAWTGGTDLAVADGGTGSSTAATARVAISVQRDRELDARDYGLSTGASQATNAAALQAVIDAASAGQTIRLPAGSYAYNPTPTVDKALAIRGEGQYTTVLLAVGCDGLTVDTGISNCQFEAFELATSVRYTTTPNAWVGLTIAGTTGSRPQHWVLRDVFLDGWYTAINTSYLWSSTFFNVRCGSTHIGVHVEGLSVNNYCSHLAFGGSAAAGSRGIWLDGAAVASEGWVITDSLIDSFEIGVLGQGVAHCKVLGSILDHNTVYGIYITAASPAFGGNWEIASNYIGMEGAGGTAAIANGNTISNSQNHGNTITGNRILAYNGSTCSYGVRVGPSVNSGCDSITDNTIYNFATADIRADASDPNILIRGNRCLTPSPATANIYGGGIVTDNVAANVLHISNALKRTVVAGKTFAVADAAPTTGTWVLGDVVWNRLPAAGGTMGWVCTVAGTPGTWKTFGTITA